MCNMSKKKFRLAPKPRRYLNDELLHSRIPPVHRGCKYLFYHMQIASWMPPSKSSWSFRTEHSDSKKFLGISRKQLYESNFVCGWKQTWEMGKKMIKNTLRLTRAPYIHTFRVCNTSNSDKKSLYAAQTDQKSHSLKRSMIRTHLSTCSQDHHYIQELRGARLYLLKKEICGRWHPVVCEAAAL